MICWTHGRVAIMLSHRFVVTCRRLSIGGRTASATIGIYALPGVVLRIKQSINPPTSAIAWRQGSTMFNVWSQQWILQENNLERLTSTSVLSNYKMNLELLVYEEFLQLKIKSVQRHRQMFCYQWQSTRNKNFSRHKAGEPTSIWVCLRYVPSFLSIAGWCVSWWEAPFWWRMSSRRYALALIPGNAGWLLSYMLWT